MSSRELSIVYVWDADYPWDVRTEKICRALTAAGHRVTIVARNKAWAPEREALPEGMVHRMLPWRWAGQAVDNALGFPAFFSPRWRGLIRDAVEQAKADLIIVRDLPLCPAALAIGRQKSVRVALDMAENYPAMMRDRAQGSRNPVIDALVRNPSITGMVERYCVPRFDWIFTVVEESSTRLVGIGADARRMSVVSNTPPAVRAKEAGQRVTSPTHPVTLVYLGVLEAARGIGDFVDAVAVLKERAPGRFRAIVIGGGRDAEIFKAQANHLGILNSEMTFLGKIPHNDALKVMSTADIGVIPHRATESWNTTIPNKLFDYMAAGLAVVSSDTAPCQRVIRETGCGEIFASGDAAAFAAAVLKVGLPANLRQMQLCGPRAISERYNWERDTATLLESIAEITGRARN